MTREDQIAQSIADLEPHHRAALLGIDAVVPVHWIDDVTGTFLVVDTLKRLRIAHVVASHADMGERVRLASIDFMSLPLHRNAMEAIRLEPITEKDVWGAPLPWVAFMLWTQPVEAARMLSPAVVAQDPSMQPLVDRFMFWREVQLLYLENPVLNPLTGEHL